jgi:1-acyl-sn-glycerol-3-phosphate acyltransferase
MWYGFLRTCLKLNLNLWFNFECSETALIPQHGKAILAGNHSGFLDTLILVAASTRPIRFLAAAEVFQWPVIGLILRLAKVIPLTPGRGTSGLNAALDKLNDGELLCIFPEGKLTVDGLVGKFRKGVCYLHQHSEAPIIPFSLHGGFQAWGWGKPFPTLFSPISVKFSAPLYYQPGRKDKEILNELYTQVLTLLDQPLPKESSKIEMPEALTLPSL